MRCSFQEEVIGDPAQEQLGAALGDKITALWEKEDQVLFSLLLAICIYHKVMGGRSSNDISQER